MVQYRRSRIDGGTFFFTVNLHDRRSSMRVEHIDALRNIVGDLNAKLPFDIDAMVVLPGHWHAVWTLPHDDCAYSQRIRLIKAGFTKQLLRLGVSSDKNSPGQYNLWQERFWEYTIRDDRDFETHVNYVHINPVKHEHVARAVDWPLSTIHRYMQRGILNADWACASPDGKFGDS